MTPDELERELLELDRLSPPTLDPAVLLRLESRIAELETENAELNRFVVLQKADIERQTNISESRRRGLSTFVSEHERKQKEWEGRAAEWSKREAFWATQAQRERTDQRSKGLQKAYSISLGIGLAVLGLGFVFAAERYWTFTHNEQLQMMEAAIEDKAAAANLLQEARKEYEKTSRLNQRSRRNTSSKNRTINPGPR